MPESQFGPAPPSLEATLDELVALTRHLRAVPADITARLSRLEGLAKMLDYFVAPIGAYTSPLQAPLAATTRCAFDGCSRDWTHLDACLLNFARRGEPALWLCRDHHPPPGDGGIRPPGWTPPLTEREALDAARKAAMSKITRTELGLVNGRMRGV